MGQHIMAIDADPAILALYQDVLTGAGYTVDVCDDEVMARDRLRNGLPDAIILDTHLGAPLTSWQLLALLTQDAHLRTIPVLVATTESSLPQDQAAALVQHGAALLAKPFDLDDLFGQLQRLLGDPVPPARPSLVTATRRYGSLTAPSSV